jgi:hypothetical protein
MENECGVRIGSSGWERGQFFQAREKNVVKRMGGFGLGVNS